MKAKDKADRALARVRPAMPWDAARGEDFAAVAKDESEDPDTAQNGGALENWIALPNSQLMDLA